MFKSFEDIFKNKIDNRSWQEKPATYKLSDEFILRIPAAFQHYGPIENPAIDVDNNVDRLPISKIVSFVFFMPDYSGYTEENHENIFHVDKVTVTISFSGMGQEQPGAHGSYPPNQFPRFVEPGSAHEKDYTDVFGLRCYSRNPNTHPTQFCYGEIDTSKNEYLPLIIMLPPYPRVILYPTMYADYFSKRYGGIEIRWDANMKNFSKWREIDMQVWKYIAEWNIGSSAKIK